MSLVAVSRSSDSSRSWLRFLFSRINFARDFLGTRRRGFDGDFLVDILFPIFYLLRVLWTFARVTFLTCLTYEDSSYFAEKIFQADGLCLVTVKPFSHHRLPVVRHGRCRDGDDRYTFRFRFRLKLLQRRDAVHAGELDVHKDKSERLLAGELKPFFGCFSLDGPVALDLEHVAAELAVLLIVFDDQYQYASHRFALPTPSLSKELGVRG